MALHPPGDMTGSIPGESDQALARRIARGDTEAWDAFFDRYASWAYRFAFTHLSGNQADAEDLCSDILLTAARSAGKFDPKRGDLDMWMLGLARHRLTRFCRKRRLEFPLIPELVEESSGTSFAERIPIKDLVNRTLASLPARQASALVGKYVEGYTTDELASRLHSTPKAVESLLGRARATFRTAFNALVGNGGEHCE